MRFVVLVVRGRIPPGTQSWGLVALAVETRSAREVGFFTLCGKCLRREVIERDQGKCGSAGCDLGAQGTLDHARY